MNVDLIRYDLLVQDALRAVVRRVLTDVARDGLPGDHHLYISFDTRAPGVRLSARLKERYPEEMTIVLQHQFWDLLVTEPFFEVGLSFNGIPERLHIPFEALKGFFDPSVKFGLQFEPPAAEEAEPDAPEAGDATVTSLAGPRPVELRKDAPPTSVPSTRPAPREVGKEPAKTPAAPRPQPRPAPAAAGGAPKSPANPPAEPVVKDAAKSESTRPEPAKSEPAKSASTKPEPVEARPAAAKDAAAKDDAPRDEAREGSAQVVRLDAFRKK